MAQAASPQLSQPSRAYEESQDPAENASPAKRFGSPIRLQNYRLLLDNRLLEYVVPFDRNLMCPVCHCPFVDARRLSCDHTFCRQCLRRAFQSQEQDTKTCPSCRRITDPDESLPIPRFLSNMIDELLVRCPSSGCQAQVTRGDVQSHVDHYCEYAEVACPLESCWSTIPRRLAREKCLHTILCCEYCQLTFMERDLENHKMQDCTKKPVECPHCRQETVQSKLDSHLQECDQVVVPCPAASIGCSFSSTRAKTSTHSAHCTLFTLLPTFKAMNGRIAEQEASIKMLQRRNAQLADTLDSVKEYVGDAQAAAAARVGLTGTEPTSVPAITGAAAQSAIASDELPFDSATSHLLSLHESLRDDLDRVASSVSELDARSSLMIMNETLRMKEELTHTNAALGSLRMQLQWLTSARLQSQTRGMETQSAIPRPGAIGTTAAPAAPGGIQPTRRLSDSTRQETKL